MTNDEIISLTVARHFKKLESKLLELDLPDRAFVLVSKEFRWLEQDLKNNIAYNDEDLNNFLKGIKND